MMTSQRDVERAIEELQAIRNRLDQFVKDKTVAPGCGEIIKSALNHAIDVLIPF